MLLEREKDLFVEWMEKNNIEGGLFDLDDCLVETSKDVFDWGFGKFFRFVLSKYPQIGIVELRRYWNEANAEKYRQVGVRRDRWDVAVNYLEHKISKSDLKEGLTILEVDLYRRVPRWCVGASEMLTTMKKNNIKVAVVSHADEEWTKMKAVGIGLDTLADAIISIDPRKHKAKNLEHWKQGLEAINLSPEKVIGAGDNKKTDIVEMYSLGIVNLAYIVSPWAIYSAGELPKGVPTLRNLERWIKYVAKIKK